MTRHLQTERADTRLVAALTHFLCSFEVGPFSRTRNGRIDRFRINWTGTIGHARHRYRTDGTNALGRIRKQSGDRIKNVVNTLKTKPSIAKRYSTPTSPDRFHIQHILPQHTRFSLTIAVDVPYSSSTFSEAPALRTFLCTYKTAIA